MAAPENRVYLFWDSSNMFIPAKQAAANMGEAAVAQQVRVQFDNLYQLARGGREVQRAYAVGSVPPDLGRVWSQLRQAGLEVETFERGAESGREQAVDQALQVQMLRTALDVQPPCVAVLLTGDGAGYQEGVGFHADLERLHRLGWGIEVLSWEGACAQGLKDWAQRVGVFIPLERFYKRVTFVEGGRYSEAFNGKGRQWAKPSGG